MDFFNKLNIYAKELLLVFILFLVFIPNNTFASDSVTYSTAGKAIEFVEKFTNDLYDALGKAYKPIYLIIATLGLIFLLAKYFITKVAPIKEMISFTLAMAIAANIAFDSNIFKFLIYDSFFSIIYGLDQLIIQASAPNLPDINAVQFKSISGLLQVVDNSLMAIADFALQVAHANELWVLLQKQGKSSIQEKRGFIL